MEPDSLDQNWQLAESFEDGSNNWQLAGSFSDHHISPEYYCWSHPVNIGYAGTFQT
jgi:hypothetical protein